MTSEACRSTSSTRPNIMLLQGEDVGRHLACIPGNPEAITPNLDRLASDGCMYTHAFSTAPVSAPSRGAMISGRYAWSLGNHHMRSRLSTPPTTFTGELVKAGYHVSWPTKLDFNFAPGPDWCSDRERWWEKPAPRDKPFFVYQNFVDTHESCMFPERPPYLQQDLDLPPELVHDPAEVTVPPHLPDTQELRTQIAKYHDSLTYIDREIGKRLRWLDDQGLRENTIVIFLTDHGRGLPREKRWCYDAGVHLPLIIRWPGQLEPNRLIDELVSWVDIAPTLLSLAGVDVPESFEGRCFLGDQRDPERDFVFAGRDRMDLVFDRVRMARDKKWHYIRNDFPELPWAQHQAYMERQAGMTRARVMHAEGDTDGWDPVFFSTQKPAEELYDAENDPHMLTNLAELPAYAEHLERLRSALSKHENRFGDLGRTSEETLIEHGVVEDMLASFREKMSPLPAPLQMEPYPIPVTLQEAEGLRHASQNAPAP